MAPPEETVAQERVETVFTVTDKASGVFGKMAAGLGKLAEKAEQAQKAMLKLRAAKMAGGMAEQAKASAASLALYERAGDNIGQKLRKTFRGGALGKDWNALWNVKPAKRFADHLDLIGAASDRAYKKLGNIATLGLGKLGVGLGVGALAAGMWHAAAAADDMEDTMATVYAEMQKPWAGRMQVSMGMAAESMEKIHEMAARGVAPTHTYQQAFTALLPAMQRAKATQKDILELTENMVPALGSGRHGMEGVTQKAYMLGRIFSGGRGMRMADPELLRAMGMDQATWTKLAKNPVKLFQAVKKQMAGMATERAPLFQDAPDSLQRMKNMAEEMMTILGKPVFAAVSKQLESALGYVRAHKKEVQELAAAWGKRVGWAVAQVGKAIFFIAKHVKMIIAVLATLKAVSLGSTLVKMGASIGKGEGLFAAALSSAGANVGKFGKAVSGIGVTLAKAGLIGAIAGLVYEFLDLIGVIPMLKDAITSTASSAWNSVSGLQDTLWRRAGFKSAAEWQANQAMKRELYRHGAHRTKAQMDDEAALRENLRGAKTNMDFRGSRFDITQKFQEGFDPDRIAAVFTKDLAGAAERRLSSGFQPIFGAGG